MIRRYLFASVGIFTLALFSSCGMFSKKVKKEAVLPLDREQIQVKTAVKTYTPEEIRNGVVKGDWAIDSVAGKAAIGEDAPFIKFVPQEKRIYGNNGCNVINGSYKYNPADSTLSFENVAMTMRLCHKEGITDSEISSALDRTRFYTWSAKESDYYLYFYDENHQPLMTLMHQNFQFLNGTWRVTAIEGVPMNLEDMKLVIDVDEGKLHGNTGCNIMNGTMEIDMDRPNSISFQAIATTKMACPDAEYETVLLVALEEASAAKPLNSNEVALFNSDNKEVLRLVRATDK